MIQHKSYKWWLLLLVMVGTAMAVLDSTIVNVGIPVIMRMLDTPLEMAQWVVTAYLVSMCVMLPTAGWIAQKWGYKKIYLTGLVVFTLGSLLCTFASSIEWLVAARVIEGFGSGTVQSLGMAIIIRHFDNKMRGLALGLWAIAAAASVSMGPYLGGILLTHFHWNALFMVNVPVGVIASVATFFVMREVKDSPMGRFDLVGFLLVALATPLLVVGLAMGAAQTKSAIGGWDSPFVISSIIISLVMLVFFVLHSLRNPSPVIDLSIFRNRSFAVSIIALTCFGIGLYGGNYLLPLYLEHSLSYSALAAGSVFLPVGLIQGSLAPLTGVFSRWTGNKILIVSGLVIFTSYFLLSSIFDTTTSAWLISTTVYMRGIGIGLAFTPLNTMAVSNLTPPQMTSASGVANTVKQVSGSIGIAIFTALISSSTIAGQSLACREHDYVGAIDTSFMLAAIFSILGLVAVLFLREKRATQDK
ncbi:MAG: DHA2 family efflux MFS transporter permease subunit [Mucinivorans sp.]